MDKDPKYISQEQQEAFESYLLGKMTVEQELAFTKSLEESVELRKQFEEFKNLFLAVEERALRASLEDFHQGLEEKSEAQSYQFNFLRIAAGIAVLIALALWYFSRPNINERLYKEYYTPDPGLPTVMGSNENYEFYKAMVDYKQGHYNLAIETWERMLKKKSENDTLNYFIGSAYLANGNLENATVYFRKTLVQEESVFFDDTTFYLGLVSIKQGNPEKAIEFLKLSESTRNKTLLEELEK